MRKQLRLLAAASVLLSAVLGGQQAQAADPRHARAPAWHGDIHRFQQHDLHVWRGGHWVRGHHEGRGGWWWVIGPTWYFYPAPVYPYPDPYVPPPAVPLPPPVQYWYYCQQPAGYYPYVPSCPGGWTQVPANGETP